MLSSNLPEVSLWQCGHLPWRLCWMLVPLLTQLQHEGVNDLQIRYCCCLYWKRRACVDFRILAMLKGAWPYWSAGISALHWTRFAHGLQLVQIVFPQSGAFNTSVAKRTFVPLYRSSHAKGSAEFGAVAPANGAEVFEKVSSSVFSLSLKHVLLTPANHNSFFRLFLWLFSLAYQRLMLPPWTRRAVSQSCETLHQHNRGQKSKSHIHRLVHRNAMSTLCFSVLLL